MYGMIERDWALLPYQNQIEQQMVRYRRMLGSLTGGRKLSDFANLFVAYRAFNEDDPSNSARFIGLDKKTCDTALDLTLALCLEDADEESRRDKIKRIMAVGYVRFLYLVIVMRFGGEEFRDLRIRHTIGHLYELLDSVDGFAI